MYKYFFSGAFTRPMAEYMKQIPDMEPIDVLVTQLDRNSIKDTFKYQDEGLVNQFFLDSGAFSVHTGKANTTVEEYVEYINSIDDRIYVCAQLDTIPGKFGQPKSSEDYKESAQKSWDNYLSMRTMLKSPQKLMPVFHYGESFDALRNMLEWTDEDGNHLEWIGISPANDTSQQTKNKYLENVYDIIKHSSTPDVHTHLYGMTSLDALTKYPCYSADSISHRLISAYNKIYTREFGVVSVSKKPRTTKTKSNLSFIETADPYNIQKLEKIAEHCKFTIDQLSEDNAARCVLTMYEIQQFIKENPYKPSNLVKNKKLFSI